jgi:stalled ribosome rescue protein Dom34
MAPFRSLGIWMNDSSAHLINFENGLVVEKIVLSEHTTSSPPLSSSSDDSVPPNNPSGYYDRIRERLMEYDDIVLFGPSIYKSQLLRYLQNDVRFDRIKIKIRNYGTFK